MLLKGFGIAMIAKFCVDRKAFLETAEALMFGWKPKRIKRALKQIKRNVGDANGVKFFIDHVGEIAAAVSSEGEKLSTEEYTGDIAALIDVLLEEGTLKKEDKVSTLIKRLRKSGRDAAADLIVMTVGKFNGDVNDSCKLGAFLGMLDKDPSRRKDGGSDFITAAGERAAELQAAANV